MTLAWRDGEYCNTSTQSAPQRKKKETVKSGLASIFSLVPSKEALEIGKQ